jgi:hypothetical protein
MDVSTDSQTRPLSTDSQTRLLSTLTNDPDNKTVQIIGAFNTGTNLIVKMLDALFKINLQVEGHTIFWKHTCITDNFHIPTHLSSGSVPALLPNSLVSASPAVSTSPASPNLKIWYIVVTKHPYWWFHSIHKRQYSLTTENKPGKVGIFIREPIRVTGPIDSKFTDTSLNATEFPDFVDYYNKFYNGCRNYLPKEQTIYINYTDILDNPMAIIDKLADIFPLKRNYRGKPPPIYSLVATKNANPNYTKDYDLMTHLKSSLNKILLCPTKKHGDPRYGKKALEWYKQTNLEKLFNKGELDWINDRLDNSLMLFLGFRKIHGACVTLSSV